jgi:anti-sigma factor RsiW
MPMNENPSCDRALLLEAEFDGELDAAQAVALATHRKSCAICEASWRRLSLTRQALREGATYHRAPASLRSAIEARLAAAAPPVAAPVELPAPRARRLRIRWREAASFGLGAALAAMLVLALLPSGQDSMIGALVDDHVRSLQPGHLTDVLSSNRHTVKPWFDGRIDFAPPVKDLAQQGFPLIGGRLDYLAGRAVAVLAYEHGKHPVSLFVWPERAAAGAAPPGGVRNGYNLLHWTADGMSLWAVSDLERDQLQDFVRDWQASP